MEGSPLAWDAAVSAWAEDLVDLLDRAYQFQHSAVFLADDGDDRLRLAGQRWGAGEDLGVVRLGQWTVPIDGSVMGRAFRSATPVLVPDVTIDPDYRTYPGARARSELAVPILRDGRAIGVINVESPRVSAYDIADLERLETQARLAAERFPG